MSSVPTAASTASPADAPEPSGQPGSPQATASPAPPLPPPSDVLLQVDGVSLRLGDVPILSDVSFAVRDRTRPGATTGQVVGLLGPSGVGKTRLLRIIAGLDAPDRGSVRGAQGAVLPAGSVGVVFQNYPLLRHRTVAQNLEIAAAIAGLERQAGQARAKALLERFGLSGRANVYPAQLSGGQRQRVAIAQQLVQPRRLLLMDEPFSGLDPATLGEVIALVVEVAHQHEHNTIILVTHDVRAALIASDTLLMLGRSRAGDRPVPGACIQATYDLVERGLAWQPNVEALPTFAPLEQELKGRFSML